MARCLPKIKYYLHILKFVFVTRYYLVKVRLKIIMKILLKIKFNKKHYLLCFAPFSLSRDTLPKAIFFISVHLYTNFLFNFIQILTYL